MSTSTRTRSTRKILGRSQGWGIAAQSSANPKVWNLVEAYGSRDAVRQARRTEYDAPNFKVVRINATFTAYSK